MLSVPADLPPPGQRRVPPWVRRYLSFAVIGPALILLIPLCILIAGIASGGDAAAALIFTALFVGLIPGIILLVAILGIASRRRLIQRGNIVPQEIMWSDFENRTGETMTTTRTFVMEYWFTAAGGRDRVKFTVGAKKMKGCPFPPASGDTVLIACDAKKPKKHEIYGFVAADGRWWVPGR